MKHEVHEEAIVIYEKKKTIIEKTRINRGLPEIYDRSEGINKSITKTLLSNRFIMKK